MLTRVTYMLLAISSSNFAAAKNAPLAWRQDLRPSELLAIDVENPNSPHNDRFKIPHHEAHAIRLDQH